MYVGGSFSLSNIWQVNTKCRLYVLVIERRWANLANGNFYKFLLPLNVGHCLPAPVHSHNSHSINQPETTDRVTQNVLTLQTESLRVSWHYRQSHSECPDITDRVTQNDLTLQTKSLRMSWLYRQSHLEWPDITLLSGSQWRLPTVISVRTDGSDPIRVVQCNLAGDQTDYQDVGCITPVASKHYHKHYYTSTSQFSIIFHWY